MEATAASIHKKNFSEDANPDVVIQKSNAQAIKKEGDPASIIKNSVENKSGANQPACPYKAEERKV